MGESVGCIFEEVLGRQHRMLFCDNTAAISLATQKGGNWRTRHLKVRAAHLRWKTENGHWKVQHRPGEFMVADIGTKPLRPRRFQELTPLIGMGKISEQAEEYARFGWGGRPREDYFQTHDDENDPRMYEPTDWEENEMNIPPTPPTDEEMAAAVVRSFEVDMEKVSVLVKMIAAFQSVQGVSAKLAEESEEQSYQHMMIYGVFMAVLGASVYHLIRYWWERRGGGHEITEEDHGRKEDPVVETGRSGLRRRGLLQDVRRWRR